MTRSRMTLGEEAAIPEEEEVTLEAEATRRSPYDGCAGVPVHCNGLILSVFFAASAGS